MPCMVALGAPGSDFRLSSSTVNLVSLNAGLLLQIAGHVPWCLARRATRRRDLGQDRFDGLLRYLVLPMCAASYLSNGMAARKER